MIYVIIHKNRVKLVVLLKSLWQWRVSTKFGQLYMMSDVKRCGYNACVTDVHHRDSDKNNQTHMFYFFYEIVTFIGFN